MGKIVGTRFRPGGKIYNCDAGHFVVSCGSHVIVETTDGLAFGTVVTTPRPPTKEEETLSLKKVYRMANDEDVEQYKKNLDLERSAFTYCNDCIKKLGLDMHLVSVQTRLEADKLTFYYTADGRVDFRELVKMLVKTYKVRIEMRQIGVRNRAKMIGGIGPCGHELCCHAFMREFHPVSVRMAKEQGLSLNPSKISGLCGRLMCCLAFEYDTYCELKKKFPDCGKIVRTQKGRGKVVRHNVLKESIVIQVDEAHQFEVGLNEITSVNAQS